MIYQVVSILSLRIQGWKFQCQIRFVWLFSDVFIVEKVTITVTCNANATQKKQKVNLQE